MRTPSVIPGLFPAWPSFGMSHSLGSTRQSMLCVSQQCKALCPFPRASLSLSAHHRLLSPPSNLQGSTQVWNLGTGTCHYCWQSSQTALKCSSSSSKSIFQASVQMEGIFLCSQVFPCVLHHCRGSLITSEGTATRTLEPTTAIFLPRHPGSSLLS